MKVAFIGLGNMGFPMAGHLATQGHDVTVYNRTAAKADLWLRQYGGRKASTPAEAAAHADFVFTCVGNDDDLSQVVLGETGAIQGMRPGTVLVDHSTVSATLSRDLANILAGGDMAFVDAPVSGGQQGAQRGQLSIMCGAEEVVFRQVEPLLACYGKTVVRMGDVGSGQLTKMVNQICVAGLIEALAEGLYFAEKAGLDATKAMQVIGQGAASSWQLVNRHATMLADEYDHGFAVDWMRKDLDICLEEAAELGINLPVTAQVSDFYREIQAMNGGRWDTSSLLRRLKQT
ncbi:3-hydroxyisobutyrate dehydrogenase [Fluviicoccus keumensis]|uniref:3-hydroxyisobutyrate dehydrogenase n=1 Tax=Fluviicoccus keumensis TaxID=1435465 RepID=A0A4Q7Z5K5_9GAMM|nr:NAD(P)-dependent oxidoreductase [Fluviicoccus keumensis]RZU44935.1 3-hydroxyisobutyrate dehydrogenase [Fluviicoccus keumensis]